MTLKAIWYLKRQFLSNGITIWCTTPSLLMDVHGLHCGHHHRHLKVEIIMIMIISVTIYWYTAASTNGCGEWSPLIRMHLWAWLAPSWKRVITPNGLGFSLAKVHAGETSFQSLKEETVSKEINLETKVSLTRQIDRTVEMELINIWNIWV